MFKNIYGEDKFVASKGWLFNFTERHGLRHLKICVEKSSNDETAVAPVLAKLRQVIEAHDLQPRQIYTAEESGLFWKLLPDKTFVQSNEARKSSKERITFLACTNGDGSHKLRPLVIGKAKNPRGFKNKALPVDYVSSENASMTPAIFKTWFQDSFSKQVKSFLKNQRLPEKALLLIDNAPSHCPEEELISEDGHIFTMFLPPRSTALIQPMHQNAIKSTKLNYRKSLLAHILSILEDGDDVGKCIESINLFDAVCLLHNSWQKVTTNSSEKYWHELLSCNLPNYDPDDLIPLNLLQEKMQQINHDYQDISNMLTKIDGEVYSNIELNQWVEDAEKVMEDGYLEHDTIDDDTSSDEEVDINPNKIKHVDAIKYFKLGLQWAEENNIGITDILLLKNIQEKAVVKHSSTLTVKKQHEISDYSE
ncbi:jerky protein homolog-like [Harmonia axyridis]|uniref:jerky protein homolog-like n=1 Tax=Harmonia axyridis TaxID=115357 RepID=UPI001E2759F2|nr:jerky protein homolog-like [Harmonia axyridis]